MPLIHAYWATQASHWIPARRTALREATIGDPPVAAPVQFEVVSRRRRSGTPWVLVSMVYDRSQNAFVRDTLHATAVRACAFNPQGRRIGPINRAVWLAMHRPRGHHPQTNAPLYHAEWPVGAAQPTGQPHILGWGQYRDVEEE